MFAADTCGGAAVVGAAVVDVGATSASSVVPLPWKWPEPDKDEFLEVVSYDALFP